MEFKKLLILCFTIFSLSHLWSSDINKGNESFRNREYEKALEFYNKKPGAPKAVFNKGLALYASGNYQEAASVFEETSRTFKKPEDISESFYQMGNSFNKLADELLNKDAEKAMGFYNRSLESYRSSIKYNSDNEDAEYNLEITKRKLETAEKQQQEQQGQSGDKSDKSEEKNNQKKQNSDKNNSSNNNEEEQNQQEQSSDAEKEKEQQKKEMQQNKENTEKSEKEKSEMQEARELLDKEKQQQEERRKYQMNKIMDVEKDW